MADDKMKHDDLDRKMGGGGDQGDQYSQQSPGRNRQDDEQFGQKGGGQGTLGNRGKEDDLDLDRGAGQTGNQQRGGQGGQDR